MNYENQYIRMSIYYIFINFVNVFLAKKTARLQHQNKIYLLNKYLILGESACMVSAQKVHQYLPNHQTMHTYGCNAKLCKSAAEWKSERDISDG